MLTRAELQQALTRATAERAAAEHFASTLRANLTIWRKQEAGRGQVAQALLWGHNQDWIARIEALAVSADREASDLRTQESELVQKLWELAPE
jgi:hypothetical protein